MSMTRAELQNLRSVDRALHFARTHIAADITAQRLSILINVFLNEGACQHELLKSLEGTSTTALSRNLADLSALSTRKTPGPGLLELRTDPMNLRTKRVFLTPKGKRFVSQWVAAMKQNK